MKLRYYFVSVLLACIYSISAQSLSVENSVSCKDDTNHSISLKQPARRIISLSPAITELVYAAGGGQYLKGVVSYTDYPEQAKYLPEVGSFNALDLEKILSLKPDLIIAWKSGNPSMQIKKLKKLGIAVYVAEPAEISDIPRLIEKLGQLMGTGETAEKSAMAFKSRFEKLKSSYPPIEEPVKVFIQIWDKPLMSVSGKHLISEVVSQCGGHNIFANYPGLTLNPDIETVLYNDPGIIITTASTETAQQWLDRWKQWDYLDAVRQKRLYAVNADILVRHTPRILDGLEQVCTLIYPVKKK